tara:strand:- start:127 stop:300 length:174 start_codon:yes stop_codon:yes gene_type:complete
MIRIKFLIKKQQLALSLPFSIKAKLSHIHGKTGHIAKLAIKELFFNSIGSKMALPTT